MQTATKDKKMTLPSLAGPIMLENFLRMFMGSVNVIMLGHYSDNAVGAVGVANQFINMLIMIYSITSAGTGIVINQYLGAGEKKAAARVSSIAVSLNALIGFGMSFLIAIFSKVFLRMMDLPQDMMGDAVIFLMIVGGTSFLQAIISAISVTFRSHGKARLSMYVALLMNLLNLAGNYIVIFRPFETPFYGVSGVALCQMASAFIACLLMGILYKTNLKLSFSLRQLIPFPKKEIKEILSIGLPPGAESLSYNLTQIICTYIITKIGTDALAARIYVQNIVFYVYMFGLSVGQASQIIIGHLVGAGKPDQAIKVNAKNLKIAIAANILISLLVILFRRELIGLFTNSPDIIALAMPILIFDIVVEVGRAFNHIEGNSLRGAGDVRFCMIVAVCSMWGITVLASYLLGITAGLGLLGVWIAFAMDEWFRGLMLFRRWKSGNWISKAIIRAKAD